jgi:hypothetical protein
MFNKSKPGPLLDLSCLSEHHRSCKLTTALFFALQLTTLSHSDSLRLSLAQTPSQYLVSHCSSITAAPTELQPSPRAVCKKGCRVQILTTCAYAHLPMWLTTSCPAAPNEQPSPRATDCENRCRMQTLTTCVYAQLPM